MRKSSRRSGRLQPDHRWLSVRGRPATLQAFGTGQERRHAVSPLFFVLDDLAVRVEYPAPDAGSC